MPDTQSGAALLEAARRFRPRIIAERDRIEADRRIPEELAQELARAGFFRLLLPEAARAIHADPDVITANSTRSSGQVHILPDGFRVSGRWSLVSGCELGSWMVLLCVVHEDGKPRLTPAGTPENRFMLIPSAA